MFGIDLGPIAPMLTMLKAKLHMTEQDVPRAEVIDRLREMASVIAADPEAGVTIMRARMGGKELMILATSYEGKSLDAGNPAGQVAAELPV